MTTDNENPTNTQAVQAIPVADATVDEGASSDKDFFDEEDDEAGGTQATAADDDEDDVFSDKPPVEDDEEDDFAFVELFDKKCLRCTALVPFGEKRFKGCHFTQGNEHCPAATLKLVVRIPLEKIVMGFMAAEEQGDSSRLARLYAHLATKEDWYQARVNEALKAARQERDAKSK